MVSIQRGSKNKQQYFTRQCMGCFWKIAYKQWYKRCGFASYCSVSVPPCSFAHICSRIILGLVVVWFQFSLLNMPFYGHDSVNTDMRFIMVR